MDNFFQGLVADRNAKLTGAGENPTVVGNIGNSLARIKQRMKLPTEISAQQVIKLEQESGKVAGELELAKAIASKQKELLNQDVQLHAINADWAATTMDADLKLRQIQGKHHQKVAQYSLGAATEQAWTDGYQEAYQMSAEIFG